jgi:exodeoxyribonuclease X
LSRLADSSFLVMDTETTGIDPASCKVVEFAWVLTDLTGPRAAGTTLVNPGCPIPPEASAVHHLVDADVAGEPTLEQALGYLPRHLAGHKVHAFVAHNAAFDSAFLPTMTFRPWLCTYRMARRLMPDFPAFGNQYLRYALKLDVPEAQGLAAHRALADAYVTAATLRHLLRQIVDRPDWPQEIPDLAAHLAQPMLLPTVGFGKHKGQPWASVPRSYLTWMLGAGGMTDLDIDTRHTAEFYLKGGRK